MMKIILLLGLIATVTCDVYMHALRGSNNRITGGENGNTQDANRLFDSQDNNNGGYDKTGTDYMKFYSGSVITLEWTAQHGCSPDSNYNLNCEQIFQYMCDENLRDGTNNNRIAANEAASQDTGYGMHENYDYFVNCSQRERNMGLYIADETLNGNTAQFTRQNNNGNRHGYECPEERDYYPYWHPTPWKDIVIMTSNTEKCDYYKKESQNVKDKGYCYPSIKFNRRGTSANDACPGDEWHEGGAHNIPAPECIPATWTRDNHLGNGIDGRMAHYNWTVPEVSSTAKCSLRLRYNISTSDYDGWSTDAKYNTKKKAEDALINQDPYVEYGWPGQGLELALNTNQYGRTFQDRSHMFAIMPTTPAVESKCPFGIKNLQVRGKRGNLVQAYPGMEYDFTPNRLEVLQGECIHFQWTGADSYPQRYQGYGQKKTDRTNICQISDLKDVFCMPLEEQTMFPTTAMAKNFAHLDSVTNKGPCKTLKQILIEQETQGVPIDQNPDNCAVLNHIKTPYFDGGLVPMTKEGVFHYMSTRNNAPGRRSMKGTIVVLPNPEFDVSSMPVETTSEATTSEASQAQSSTEAVASSTEAVASSTEAAPSSTEAAASSTEAAPSSTEAAAASSTEAAPSSSA